MSEQLAYLAGMMDGEGTFSIQIQLREYKGRTSVQINPRMSMTLTYGAEVLNEFKESFGGEIYPYKNGDKCWSLGKRDLLIDATNALLPYLRIKREIAERFLEALAVFPTRRKAHSKGERSWTPEMIKQVVDIAFSLNKTNKIPKALIQVQDYIASLN